MFEDMVVIDEVTDVRPAMKKSGSAFGSDGVVSEK